MLEFIDLTTIFSLTVGCLTVYGSVHLFLKQSEKNLRRENEHELMKVRMYTDRDIRTAQIENMAMAQGFNDGQGMDDSTGGLISLALKNPELVNQLVEKFKK